MTCAQILAMTSSDWIAKVAGMNDSQEDGQLRGIRAYGGCYDERTDKLAASLARTGKGPSMSARTNFRNFDSVLKDFTTVAMATTQQSGDTVKAAYSALYEKQFRYDFYKSYEEKAMQSSPHASTAGAPPPTAAGAATAPAAAPTNAQAAAAAASNLDPLTKAKNHFGEILDSLPEDKLHQLHAAFGKALDAQPPAGATQIEIYCYAIFVLETPVRYSNSPASKGQPQPFSPPPF